MNKKEKEVLQDFGFFMEDNNFDGAKRFFNEESIFIENEKRSSEFFDKIEKIREWLFTPYSNSISYETDEYYRQENKITEDNNPEII